PCRASITMARRLPGSGHSGPYSSAAPQFMLVERSSRSTGSFLRLEETAGRISLRGVRFGPPVSARASLTIVPFPLWISTRTPDVPHAYKRGTSLAAVAEDVTGGDAVTVRLPPAEHRRPLLRERALALLVVLRSEAGLDHRLDPGEVMGLRRPGRFA